MNYNHLNKNISPPSDEDIKEFMYKQFLRELKSLLNRYEFTITADISDNKIHLECYNKHLNVKITFE